DERTLNRWFDQVDRDLGVAPRDAAVQVKDGKVTIVPEVAGTVVDRERTKQSLIAALAGLQAPSGSLPTILREPRVRTADLATVKARLEQALAQPVTVKFEQQTWTLNPTILGNFVVQQIDDAKTGAAAVTFSLDRKPLTEWLTALVGVKVNRDPVDAV